MSDADQPSPRNPLDYENPSTGTPTHAYGNADAGLAMLATLYAIICAFLATPSTGYGADSAKQWPILLGVLIGVAYPAWRAYGDAQRRTWKHASYVTCATLGMSLVLVPFGLTLRAFRLDPGFPQPRYRPAMLSPIAIVFAIAGLGLLVVADAIRRRGRS